MAAYQFRSSLRKSQAADPEAAPRAAPARPALRPAGMPRFLQARLRAGQPGDIYEQQADQVARALLRGEGLTEEVAPAPPQIAPLAAGSGSFALPPAFEDDLQSRRGAGSPLPAAERAFFEPRLGIDLGAVRLHTDPGADQLNHALNADAFTVGRDIFFRGGGYSPGSTAGRDLLAHELTHVAQQNGGAGQPALQRQPSGRVSSPHDKVVVARARQKLALLEKFVAEWEAREARRLGSGRERDTLLAKRKRMDLEGSDIGPPGARIKAEEQNLANLNRQPLTIQVTDKEIRIQVRFQVVFEDPQHASRLGDLRKGLQDGINLIWNQTLGGQVFSGRKLVIDPQLTPAAKGAARDLRYWLIIVRATDLGPATYPGCPTPTLPKKTPTSVTDSTCAGGVMNIPPLHISKPDVLGHELLHLFGLIDRYMMLTSISRTKDEVITTEPTRETGGRPDPLGGETGKVLPEDLAFLFDRLGVYEAEANRDLNTLRDLEKQGLTITFARGEITRLQEIIRLGYDPNSLLPERKDFRDKIQQSAEDLD